ncbi:serine hydrolase domain-containing protein [Streptomyces sp. NPDC021100]|uniref:serine hydrolase domain-containing protein n=1 Tax=Streptomyces sp. NPDC021100 TaxID=3365114 RepID=UPI0037B2ABDF
MTRDHENTTSPSGITETDRFADLLPATRRALLHHVATTQVQGRAPSLVAALVRDGRPVWAAGRGTVDGCDPDPEATQYRIGSITKALIAVLVLRLRDEGLLDLGDPLGRHLDTPAGGEATVAQLLAHGSGLAAESRGPWWERTDGELRPTPEDLFGERPQRHRAGELYHYSNTGYALLGALVEKLRGEPWYPVLRREVLLPLGMERTTYGPEAPHAEGWAVHPWADVVLPEPAAETGLMAPAGQLWSTAADLGRFAAFLMEGDERVLSAATLAEMRRPAAEPQNADWSASYGLGLQLIRMDGRVLVGHAGSMPGFVGAVLASPEEGVAAATLANQTSMPEVVSLAARLVLTTAETEPRIPEPWRPDADPDLALLELTGPWYWGPRAMALRLGPGRTLDLAPLAGGGVRASRFRPEEDGTWTGLDHYFTGETLRVVRRADGTVSHLDIGSFVFTREPYAPEDAVPGGVAEDGWR